MSRSRYYGGPSVGETVSAGIASLLLIIPLVLINGFVVKTLWNWFVPLIFETAPRLNVGLAIGLALVVATLVSSGSDDSSDDDLSPWGGIILTVFSALLRAGMLLLIGAFVHASVV
jgi:hypothetical protein